MDFNNDFDDTLEDEEKGLTYGGRDGVILLIDATQPMFQKEDDDDAPFKTCLECCKTAMVNKIIISQRDLFGIVFYGTSKTENELKASHIVTFQELSETSADKIKQLEKMVASDDCDDFETKYGHSNDFSLSDTLWLCQTMFSKSPYKLSTFRILLFTNTSDPHAGDAAKQRQARVRAGDLAQAGIELELLLMGTSFDMTLFYKELAQLAAGESGNDFELPGPVSDYDELMARVSTVDHKRRALCKVFFHLGNDVTLAVNLFNLVQKARMPKPTLLDQASNEPVKAVTQFYDMQTAEVMLPAEVLKSQKIGDRKILLRFDETRDLHKMTKPGMELLGFKPESRVKIHHHIRPSSFIYPNDSLIKGSRSLFMALLERCNARAVVPICYLTPRQNSTPKLVALLPQMEKFNKKGSQELPPGFHVIYLPYADNIRKLQLGGSGRASAGQVAKATQVLKKIRFKYRPSSFDNPKLDVMWSNIEALALEHEAPAQVTDFTRPNHEAMKGRLGGLAQEFVDAVYPADYDPLVPKKKPSAAKRAADNRAAGAAKVPKTDNLSDEEMAALVRENRVNKLTVSQLKTFLSSKYFTGLSSKKKDALVDMVERFVDGTLTPH